MQAKQIGGEEAAAGREGITNNEGKNCLRIGWSVYTRKPNMGMLPLLLGKHSMHHLQSSFHVPLMSRFSVHQEQLCAYREINGDELVFSFFRSIFKIVLQPA